MGDGGGGLGLDGGEGLGVTPLMAMDEDAIKQEEGIFCGISGNNGDSSSGGSSGNGVSGAVGGPVVDESLSTSAATSQLIHHHLQSPPHNANSSSGSRRPPPLATSLMGNSRTRTISSSSNRDRYSPSTTALPSEVCHIHLVDQLSSTAGSDRPLVGRRAFSLHHSRRRSDGFRQATIGQEGIFSAP